MTTETTSKLELLPRGAFIIHLESGKKIEGRFCTWSLRKFSEQQKVQSFLDLASKLTKGLGLDDIVQLLLSAVQYNYLKANKLNEFQFTDLDACEWIDELGGMRDQTSKEIGRLVKHALTDGDVPTSDDAEKKAQPQNTTAGVTSNEQLMQTA